MSDVIVTLNFDYSNDTNFNLPTFPFTRNGVNALDVNNVDAMSDYFKRVLIGMLYNNLVLCRYATLYQRGVHIRLRWDVC